MNKNPSYSEQELINIINENLKQSANIIYKKATKLCKHGIVDENCFWYHSAWQYLRLLNLVSSPTWHDNFYLPELVNIFCSNQKLNVLVSGTADYTILAYVIYAAKVTNCNVNIDVLDTCKTPLYACKEYAKKQNYKIKTINLNIFDHNKTNYYDVILTDAFLTRFNKTDAQGVVNKWHTLLKQNGKLITTVRVHLSNEKSSAILINTLNNNFIERAKENSQELNAYINKTPDEIAQIAKTYIENMKSNSLGDDKDIINLFKEYKCKTKLKTVVGELKQTTYLEIVATKQ